MKPICHACESRFVQRLWRISWLAIPLLVACAAVVLLWSRHVYKQWPWSSYPDPLRWCGRDYAPQGSQTRAEVLRAQPHADFHKAGNVPGWLNQGEVWTTDPGNGCADVVPVGFWVKLSDDRFEVMVIEGSP
jgi:hypothetical protein